MSNFKRIVRRLVLDTLPRAWILWTDLRRSKESERERLYLEAILPKEGIAVDVGANMGLYSRVLSKFCKTVYAFEPIPEMATILSKTTAGNVIVRNIALSDHSGEAWIHVPIGPTGPLFGVASLNRPKSSERNVEVRRLTTSTLDEEKLECVSFIKIDVEGHELAVLAGACSTIKKYRPIVLVETEERHSPGAPTAVRSYFHDKGYSGYFIVGSALHPMSTLDLVTDQNVDSLDQHERCLPGKRYINNFFFFPAESDAASILGQLLLKSPASQPAGRF